MVSDSLVPKLAVMVPVPLNTSVPSDTVNTVNENSRSPSSPAFTSNVPEAVTRPETVTPSLHQAENVNVALNSPVTSFTVPLYEAEPPQLPASRESDTETTAPDATWGEDDGASRAAFTASSSTRATVRARAVPLPDPSTGSTATPTSANDPPEFPP